MIRDELNLYIEKEFDSLIERLCPSEKKDRRKI